MNQLEIDQRIQTFMKLRTSKKGTINAMLDMEFIRYDLKKQSVTLEFPVRMWELNPVGHMHGGMICSILDITMGCASYVFSDSMFTPTIQLSVNFVKSICPNDVLLVEGICDHAGSRMVQTRAIATMKETAVLVASANGSYAVNKHQ